MAQSKNEKLWNNDLLEILNSELSVLNAEVKKKKKKVLKDIFLAKDHSDNYKLQLGFVDQDIVIYSEIMNISNLYEVNGIQIHKNNVDKQLIIPRIICELKYNGITSHGLMTYSDYASDIKSIFPHCKYLLMVRFRKSSTDNKLLRHGKIFDKIICLDDGKSTRDYSHGMFQTELNEDVSLKNRFDEFMNYLKDTMLVSPSSFTK